MECKRRERREVEGIDMEGRGVERRKENGGEGRGMKKREEYRE